MPRVAIKPIQPKAEKAIERPLAAIDPYLVIVAKVALACNLNFVKDFPYNINLIWIVLS